MRFRPEEYHCVVRHTSSAQLYRPQLVAADMGLGSATRTRKFHTSAGQTAPYKHGYCISYYSIMGDRGGANCTVPTSKEELESVKTRRNCLNTVVLLYRACFFVWLGSFSDCPPPPVRGPAAGFRNYSCSRLYCCRLDNSKYVYPSLDACVTGLLWSCWRVGVIPLSQAESARRLPCTPLSMRIRWNLRR